MSYLQVTVTLQETFAAYGTACSTAATTMTVHDTLAPVHNTKQLPVTPLVPAIT